VIIMSLRDGVLPSKQSPVTRGDCSPALPGTARQGRCAPGASVATCARNDMQEAALRELQSATGEELRPLFGRLQSPALRYGDASQSAGAALKVVIACFGSIQKNINKKTNSQIMRENLG
jgi:hypothetical protein